MRRLLMLVAFVCFFVGASLSWGEIPQLINYQGMLTTPGESPVSDGPYNLTFKIYGSESGTDSLWREYHTGVQVTNGLFNVTLGSISTLSSYVFDGSVRYLGITVGSDSELSPRTRLTSVAYAYKADIADSATVAVSTPMGGGWWDIGTVVRLQNNQDSVGIGTGLPAEKLHVVGNIRLGNLGAIKFGDDDTRIYESADNLFFTANNDIYVEPDDDIYIRADGGSDWIRFDPEAREVGIGTMEPTEMLHIENSASGGAAFLKLETSHATNYHEVGMRIQTPVNMWHLRMDDDAHNNLPDTGSLALRSQNSGKEVMVWTDDGHVGIGTTQPSSKLDVNGDLEVTGAYKGNISSSSSSDGASFPRPAYDSGWRAINQGQVCTLTHSIGGHPDNYVVDLQFANSNGRSQASYGRDEDEYGDDRGTEWRSLTNSQIQVFRWPNDTVADSIRVRIWVCK
ncbi:MAG: hypothetical protein AMJ90_06340 [candidate division Zixibacteria bacterium SM23_73_2]|nr:MAG: hypothetical protein AMJ90_06340 [candidate division Zixibacteria bacterium SM23_73_2]